MSLQCREEHTRLSMLPFAKWSLRKQEVDVRLVKWIAEKRQQSRSGHLLVMFLCGRMIEGKREVNNR